MNGLPGDAACKILRHCYLGRLLNNEHTYAAFCRRIAIDTQPVLNIRAGY